MKTKVEEKVFQIEKALNKLNRNDYTIALLTGIGGLPIFYFMLFKLTNQRKYIAKINEIIDEIFDRLNSEDYKMTFTTGLTGIGFMLNFLLKHNIIDRSKVEEGLKEIDETLLTFTYNNTVSMEQVDFLHGAIGNIFYLNERLSLNKSIENKTIELFEKLALIILDDIEKTKKVCNIDKVHEGLHKTNCGLAHGHLSYIIIFSKFLENYPKNNLIKTVIKESIDCLLSFESDDENTLSAFPSIAINKKNAVYNIHLGWCYGDQVTSLALYKVSQVLSDKKLEKKAKKIALRTLKRDTHLKALKSHLSDAGFCHGTSSLAYLHKKWYKVTNNENFKTLYEHFIGDTLKKGDQNKGIAGYQKFLGTDGYRDAIGMLDGAIGIGIVLIDYLLEDEEIDWDTFFLLD